MEWNERDTGAWVNRRLEELMTPATLEPNHEAAWRMFRRRVSEDVQRTRRTRWITGSLALSLVSIAAIPPTRTYAAQCLDACIAGSSRFGAYVRNMLSAGGSKSVTALGERVEAADFRAMGSDGHEVRLSELRGRVVVLNFWATWCDPCRAEIPWLVELQRKDGGQGLTVVGVALDESGWSAVRPFLGQYKVNYPVVLDRGEVSALYGGVDSVPTTLLLDRRGRIAVTYVGLVSKGTYAEGIRALLAEPR